MELLPREIDRDLYCHLLEAFRPRLVANKYFVYRLPDGQNRVLWRQDRRYFSAVEPTGAESPPMLGYGYDA